MASVYGLVVGTLLSGSFAVEMVTSWPGLGRLMLDALRARDVYLVAGCAATGVGVSRVSARCCRTRRSRWSIRARERVDEPDAGAGFVVLVLAAVGGCSRRAALSRRTRPAIAVSPAC